mmetsp:Transcript_38868/g.50265  ORF Transcript_38868/g.50265 Transcript_38868/m.50265 type:complete len:1237 (-) Transcript_38868:190-3900(-)
MAQQTFNDPSQSGAQQFSGGLIRPGAPQFTPQSMQGSVPQSPSGGSQAANTQPAQQLQQIPRGQPRGPRGAHAQHRAMPAQTYNPYQPQQHMMPYVQQPMYTQPQVSTLPGYPPQYNNAGYIPTTHYAQPRVPAQTQTHSSAPREKKILEIQDPTTGEVLNSKLSELKPGSPSAQANGQPQPHVPGSKAFIPTPAPAPAAAAGSVAATPQAAASPTSIPSEGPSLPQSGASSAYVSPIFGAIANGNAQEFLPAEAPNLDLGLSAVSAEEPPAPAAAGEGGDHSGPIMFGDFGGVGSDEEEAPKKDEDAEKQKAAAEAEEKKKKEEEEAAKLKEELEKAKKEAEEKAKKEVEEKAKKEAEAKAAAEKKKRQEEEAAAAAAKKKAEEEEAERRKQEAEAQKEKERAAAAEAAAKKKAEEEAKKTMKKSKVRKAALEKADSAPAEDGLLDAFTQKPAPVETPKKEPEPEPTLDVGTSDSGPLSWEDAPATPKVPLPSPSPNKMALRPGAGGKKTDKSTSESEKAIFTRAVLFQIRADLGTVERPEDLPEFKIVTTDAGGNGGGGGSFRPGGRQGGGRNNRREGGFNQGQQNHNQGGPNQPGNWQAGGRPQGPPYPDQMGRGGGYQQGGRGGRGFDQRGGGGRGGRGRGRNQPSVPEFTGPVKPLEMTENRWKPTQKGVTSQLDKAKKDVRGILNKMTREKFERLSKQLIEIRMTSSEMLNAVIGLVFDKALDEPNFGDMYADLCVQLHGNSRCWSFVKGILNEDTNQWYWTADVPTEEKALGPLASQEECLAAASQNEEVELANCPAEVEIVALRIRDKMFVKVMQCPDGAFYTVFIPEDEAREQYHISPECFNTEVDALKHAQRKTAFKRFLLNKCQEEFEKEDIYEDLKKQEKEFDWNSLKSEAEKKAKKEDFEEKRFIIKKRMLGNIRFIGELYKKDMLKENIMHDCLNHLLLLDHDKGKKKIVIPDEQDLESLGKLLCTIGKKIDNPKSKDNMERYIQKMLKIKESKGVSARTRFMIQDVVDLRKNHWVPRRQEVQAKTIKQIRKEAEREMGTVELFDDKKKQMEAEIQMLAARNETMQEELNTAQLLNQQQQTSFDNKIKEMEATTQALTDQNDSLQEKLQNQQKDVFWNLDKLLGNQKIILGVADELAYESMEVKLEKALAQTRKAKEALIRRSSAANSNMGGNECVICMDNPKEIVVHPCKHFCLCLNCSTKVTQCPMCQGNIQLTDRIFAS